MTSKDLATIEGNTQLIGVVDPQRELDDAIRACKALTSVLSQKKHPVIMNGEQYLEFEDWQTLGQFYRVAVQTGDAVPVEIDGVKGAKAFAKLINLRTGDVIGGAEAYCMRDEPKWNTRTKYETDGDGNRVAIGEEVVPWFQLASMAQTRAGAKAHRNRLAWIAVLGGYKTTPAEELTGSESLIAGKASESKYWCKEHKTLWFKKGKMTGFSHPIGDSKEWCRMPSASARSSEDTTGQQGQKEDSPDKDFEGMKSQAEDKQTAKYPDGWKPNDVGQLLQYALDKKGLSKGMVLAEILCIGNIKDISLERDFEKIKAAKKFEVK